MKTTCILVRRHPPFLNLSLWALVALLLCASTPSVEAAIALRGSATTGTTTGTSLTIAKPTEVVGGDVMIVNIVQVGNSSTAPALSGWTLISGTNLGSSPLYGAVLYRVAGGSEGTSYTFTLGSGVTDAVGDIVAFSGVDTSGATPFDGLPGAVRTSTSRSQNVSADPITTFSANAAVVMFGMAAIGAPTWSAWHDTSPGSLADLYDSQSASASVGAAWATMVVPGFTDSGYATLSASQYHGGILIALKPAGSWVPDVIGTAANISSGTTITVAVPAGGVAVNRTVIVSIAMDPSGIGTTVPVTDARGNTYSSDKDVTNGSGTAGVRTLVFSAPIATALQSGDLITVTFSTSIAAKAVSAFDVGGLAAASPRDQTASATGNSASPSSGSTATTTQPTELVFGAIGVDETSSTPTALAPGAGYTALTGAGIGGSGVSILPECQVVSATGAYAADAKLSGIKPWAAAVVTYKVAGALDHFAISTISSPQTVGTPISGVTLTAQDANNHTLGTFTGTVTFGGTAGISGISGSFTAGQLTAVSVTPMTAGSGKTFTVSASGKSGSATFDVNKANPVVTAWPTAAAITYGQTLADSALSNDSATPVGTFCFTTPSMTPNAGTASQSVTFTPPDTANYNTASSTVSVTVSARCVNLTGTRAYDGTTTAAAGILSVANRVGSDDVNLASGSGMLTSKDVGSPTIASLGNLALGGTSAGNYTLIGASGSASISRATLTITAGNDSKTYGDAKTCGAGSTNFTCSGLPPSETVGSVTITASGGTANTDPVGNYTLSPTAAAGGTFSSDNYSITYYTGTLRVLPRLYGSSAAASLSGYKGDHIRVRFVAKDADGKGLATNEVQLATADGGSSFAYSIGVPPDTATLCLKPRFFLRGSIPVPAAVRNANELTLTITNKFIGGDADNNNRVDGNDYAWVRALWGKTSNTQYDLNGDGKIDADDFPNLNGDGVIDALDYALLKAGWYQKGDDE
jgi:hypothetical protein